MTSYDAADEHLKQSAIVRAIDRSTLQLSAWWNDSQSRRLLADCYAEFAGGEAIDRYRAIGAIVAIAAAVHIAMSLTHGPRPGWFWLVIPAMALAFALPLLTASRKELR